MNDRQQTETFLRVAEARFLDQMRDPEGPSMEEAMRVATAHAREFVRAMVENASGTSDSKPDSTIPTVHADAWEEICPGFARPKVEGAPLQVRGPVCVREMHVRAIRVSEGNRHQCATHDSMESDYEALRRLSDYSTLESISLPGLPGMWVVYAVPYSS